MHTTSAIGSFETQHASSTRPTKTSSVRSTRFLKVAAVSFALTLLALGIIDPAGLRAASLATGNNLISHVLHSPVKHGRSNTASAFAKGGSVVVLLATVMGLGGLRRRKLLLESQTV